MNQKKVPISVIILTYNEEEDIEASFKSVYDWADEIFIVDSYSTDKTLEIAKKYTDKILQHEFEDYGKQRNWAQENIQTENEWVFHLDAGEKVTPELVDELKKVFENLTDEAGFLLPRRAVFMGKWIKHGGHYPSYHLRVFKKNLGGCENRLYDQAFYVTGRVKTLKGDIVDTMASDLDRWILRHNKWSNLEALEILGLMNSNPIKGNIKGSPIEQKRWLREQYYKIPLFLGPFLYFFYRYFLKLGFLDGKEGLIFHFLQGFWYRFLVDAKVYEMKKHIEKSKTPLCK